MWPLKPLIPVTINAIYAHRSWVAVELKSPSIWSTLTSRPSAEEQMFTSLSVFSVKIFPRPAGRAHSSHSHAPQTPDYNPMLSAGVGAIHFYLQNSLFISSLMDQ